MAWGRIHIVRSAVPVIEAEARRRRLTPSATISDIIEAWARSRQEGAAELRLSGTCRGPECDRPALPSGLCRTHQLQAKRGQALLPIRPKRHETRLGSIRLSAPNVARLRRGAEREGSTLAEAVRRALQSALGNPDRLARAVSKPGPTKRIGALPMPADLAERLTTTAGILGISVAEVVRRAMGG